MSETLLTNRPAKNVNSLTNYTVSPTNTYTYHVIYKITNNINGKFYYGKHSTDNLNDCYMGSGRRLGYAKKKYGIENFTKEILAYCDSSEDAYELEELVVTLEEVNNPMCYNEICGGKGGMAGIPKSEEHKRKIGEGNKGKQRSIETKTKQSQTRKGIQFSDDWLENLSKGQQNRIDKRWNKGKTGYTITKRTEDSKLKNRETNENNIKKAQEANFVKVNQYDIDGNFIQTFKSIKEAAMTLNLKAHNISACCNGYQHTTGGFKFKTIKDN